MFLAFFNLDEPDLWAVLAEQYALGTGKSLSEALLFAEHWENMFYTETVLNVKNNFCTQHVLPIF